MLIEQTIEYLTRLNISVTDLDILISIFPLMFVEKTHRMHHLVENSLYSNGQKSGLAAAPM